MSFGKAWDKFWSRLDFAMDVLPDVIDEAMSDDGSDANIIVNTNGHVVMKGHFKSLRINGKLVRMPSGVLEGKT